MSTPILHHLLELTYSNKHRKCQKLTSRDLLSIVPAERFGLARHLANGRNRQRQPRHRNRVRSSGKLWQLEISCLYFNKWVVFVK